MPYVTTQAPIRYPQVTFDDILGAPQGARAVAPIGHIGDTRTVWMHEIKTTREVMSTVTNAICALEEFNRKWASLREVPRASLYHHFTIPKRNGKRRPIDAPLDDLMKCLRELKEIFERFFYASNHTAAFAYVKKRSALEAVKRHQTNDSKWVLKTDLKGFFPNTTFDFTWHMLSMIYPFDQVMRYPSGEAALRVALDMCFLNGGLPQGTPISPMLTNLIMIPIDHELSNKLRDFDGHHLIYTRYADDMNFSCRTEFDFRNVIRFVESVFKKFGAPYTIEAEKTHYGNRNGRNWMLGVMYNKDGNITLGKRRKDALRATIVNYVHARGTPNEFSYHELQSLNGNLSYFKKVEPEYTNGLLAHYNEKYRMNVLGALRYDLKNAI